MTSNLRTLRIGIFALAFTLSVSFGASRTANAEDSKPAPKPADAKKPAAKTEAKAEEKKAPAKAGEKKPADQKSEEKKPADQKSEEKKPEAKAEEKKAPTKPSASGVSFMKEIAPILVKNCIACHNPRKSESKYTMTTFAQLAKGGQQGDGVTLEPGKPDESYFVELIRHDGQPRMPYKQDPLPTDKVALIEKWVTEGGKYDGNDPKEDWTVLLRRMTPVSIPAAYPTTVPITALAFNPDGSEIATAGYHEINFWKVTGGELVRREQGLGERVYDIAYSPDGKWLAAASGDPGQFGSARLWKVENGGKPASPRDLFESTDVVYTVAFSPDGKKIAAAGADRTVRVFEVETGKQLVLIEDHADWIFDVAFSPDGKRLASAARDKTSKVFDVEKKESLVTFPTHAVPVYTASFTPDGKAIATGGEDNKIRIWNPDQEGKQLREIGGFGGTVYRLFFSPDGKTLVAAGADKTVRLFNAADGAKIRDLSGQGDWIYSLAISRDGKTIASGSWDGDVRLWNFADGKMIRHFRAAPGLKQEGAQAAR